VIIGDGKVIGLQRTGVIIGLPTASLEVAHRVAADLTQKFPGVQFAVVGGATGMVSFTYTTTDNEGQEGA
jgi:hypothetical protein